MSFTNFKKSTKSSPIVGNNHQTILTVRTCFKCGAEFKTGNPKAQKCFNCKTPTRKRALLGADDLKGKPLSPRERQIVGLLADGLGQKEIAHRLKLTPGSIKVMVNSRLTKKVGVSTCLELVAAYYKKEGYFAENKQKETGQSSDEAEGHNFGTGYQQPAEAAVCNVPA